MQFRAGTSSRGGAARAAALTLLIVMAVVAGRTPVAAAPAAPAAGGGGGVEVIEAPLVIDATNRWVDVDDPELVARVEQVHNEPASAGVVPAGAEALGERLAPVNSGITVSFVGTPPPADVQNVVHHAVAQWDAALSTTPSGPIVVEFKWDGLGAGVLGSAGPKGLFKENGVLPQADTFYPVALANTLAGKDYNGSTAELQVTLNSGITWYVGTSGGPDGKPDLYSVVLHELGHGLGFLGSGSDQNCDATSGNPTLESAACSSYPFVYDRLVTYNGIPLLSDANPNAHLRSGALRILLSQTFDSQIYAPGSWQEGSSFSHFDETNNPPGSPGALMTPVLNHNSTERTLDAAVLGVMAGMGWPMAVGPIAPAVTSSSATSSSASVAWSLDLRSHGSAPDQVRLEAWRGTTFVASATVAASAGAATVTGLTCGKLDLRVVPIRGGVTGAYPTVPINGAPVPVAVSGADLTRTISWGEATGCGSTPTYEVQRSTDGATWTVVGWTSGRSMSVTVDPGVHQFRVRAHSSGAITDWAASIPTGISATVDRPLPLDGQLARLYRAYFLRSPDDAGFQYWLQRRAAGASLDEVSSAFAGSGEFQQRYGSLDNRHFLFLLYSNVFGRQPDLAGYNHWMARLAAGTSRGEVMAGFSESDEFIGTTGTPARQSVAEAEVYRLYVAAFLRFPDGAGQGYWTGIRNGGTSLESIANGFIGSTEFSQRYGALPNDQFVRLLYLNVLGREPDAAGNSYWVGQLNGGTSRASMLVGFSQSQEFIQATGSIR